MRRIELSASASAAQRRAHAATMVDNEATGEREHKQTLVAREQYEDASDRLIIRGQWQCEVSREARATRCEVVVIGGSKF